MALLFLFFLKEKSKGILPITDKRMTRFNITLQEGVNMVLFALENCFGGEILVPKIPSYNIMDLAEAVSDQCRIDEIGIRPGEKLHEEMISYSDSFNTYVNERYYFILPTKLKWDIKKF